VTIRQRYQEDTDRKQLEKLAAERTPPLRPIDLEVLWEPLRAAMQPLMTGDPWFSALVAAGYLVGSAGVMFAPFMLYGDFRRWFLDGTPPGFVGWWLVLAGIWETVLLQTIPVRVTMVFTCKPSRLVIVSALVFTWAHDNPVGLEAAYRLAHGLILSVIFVRWLAVSWWRAYWVTTLAHGLYNAFYLLVYSALKNAQ